jgi:hypothetical protein
MAKLPYIPIYPGDWERDANCLTATAEFALFKLTIKLNDAKNKGVFVSHFSTLSVLFKSDIESAKLSINELKITETLDISELEGGFVEIKSRRILREKALSEKRSEVGKQGGRGNTKPKSNLTQSKTKAKQKQITENEIEYDNVIDIENKEKKGDQKIQSLAELDKVQEEFQKKTLDFWGFNEGNHFQNFKLMRQVCRLFDLTDGKLEHFVNQCEGYIKHIENIGEKYKFSFENFIGTAEEGFEDGGWNKENWTKKLQDSQKVKGIELKFPTNWDQAFYLKQNEQARQLYVDHLKTTIGGRLDHTHTGYPIWKYADKIKAEPGFIMGGIGNIGKEKQAS